MQNSIKLSFSTAKRRSHLEHNRRLFCDLDTRRSGTQCKGSREGDDVTVREKLSALRDQRVLCGNRFLLPFPSCSSSTNHLHNCLFELRTLTNFNKDSPLGMQNT